MAATTTTIRVIHEWSMDTTHHKQPTRLVAWETYGRVQYHMEGYSEVLKEWCEYDNADYSTNRLLEIMGGVIEKLVFNLDDHIAQEHNASRKVGSKKG